MKLIKLTDEEQLQHMNKLIADLERVGIQFISGSIVTARAEKEPDNTDAIIQGEFVVNLTVRFTDKKHPPGGMA